MDCLHGDMDQNARERTMKGFRNRKSSILVCTDVASRGLDVKDVTHVVNYSLPRELDHYVHRIGRTARSGKAGLALSLVTPSHRGLIPRIERLTRTRMREGKLPSRKEIGARKLSTALCAFQEQASRIRARHGSAGRCLEERDRRDEPRGDRGQIPGPDLSRGLRRAPSSGAGGGHHCAGGVEAVGSSKVLSHAVLKDFHVASDHRKDSESPDKYASVTECLTWSFPAMRISWL